MTALAQASAATRTLRLPELPLIATSTEPDQRILKVESQPPASGVGRQPNRSALDTGRDSGDLGSHEHDSTPLAYRPHAVVPAGGPVCSDRSSASTQVCSVGRRSFSQVLCARPRDSPADHSGHYLGYGRLDGLDL